MPRRDLRVVTVEVTDDRRAVRVLTTNPAALRGGLDQLDLSPRDTFALIARLAEAATQLETGDPS